MNIEASVSERYSQGAMERQESLCCPVNYDDGLLAILPEEIIAKDYGCGDPSRYVHEGDVVLDLGSGGGKICYMAAQLVGRNGRVIGVDMNDDMLALARKYQREMTDKLGGDRVQFCKGQIQDLALDLDRLDAWLAQHPVSNETDYRELKAWETRQQHEQPMIADNSVDLVISNCVLNLVADEHKQQLLNEIRRVLKPGGRVAIADIVSDRPVPAGMKQDPELWSGCISGAFQEQEFLAAFAGNGFHAVCYDKWDNEPWRTVNGIDFRSVTLTAIKSSADETGAQNRELIYRGPFAEVVDDNGQHYRRGERTTVTADALARLTNPAYDNAFIDMTDNGTAGTGGCCSIPVATDAGKNSNGGCC
ncbi:MAG: methyltransferase domain-containing protein [Pseudomonadota bacterium]